MIYIGVDPDLHNTAIAAVNAGGVLDVRIAKVSKKITGREAVVAMVSAIRGVAVELNAPGEKALVVEGQEIVYSSRQGANPRDMIPVAAVAGAALALLSSGSDKYVAPVTWKGSVPKRIHQARICERLGWTFDAHGDASDGYCVPTNSGFNLTAGEWKHAMDAVGIALWLRDTTVLKDRIAAGRKLSAENAFGDQSKW